MVADRLFALVCGARPAQLTPARIASSKRSVLHIASRVLWRQARPSARGACKHRASHSTLKILVLFSSVPDLRSGCDGSARRPAGALRIQSARIALPDPACVVSLEDWPPKSIAQSFNAPAATGEPVAPSFFIVSMHQWRSVVRGVVRCKLAVALPSDTCPIQLSGGSFAVPGDKDRDRLIRDRRLRNSQEFSVNRVLLPLCPRLRRLILKRSQARH